MMDDMFGRHAAKIEIAPGAFLLTSFISYDDALLEALAAVESAAPFRHMETARGFRMSVAMTNCGGLGWVSDRRGYRYDARDPLTGKPWPAMPPAFASLAASAAASAGYPGFVPDGALINRYEVGAKLSLHQDKDEADLAAPIVSVSLGIPALFLFGGLDREAPKKKIALHHGDVAVWGGPSRLAFHGIQPLKEANHPRLGRQRINLTFRKVK